MHKSSALIMTILSGLLLSGCMNDSTSHSHKTIAKVTASAVSTSSAKQTTENPKLSTKQQTAYNDTMSHALIQDQQDARQGKKSYKWSLYIKAISYDIDNGYLVKVNNHFQSLTTAQKTAVGNHVQSFAQSQLMMIGKHVKATGPVPYLVFKLDGSKIGHSDKAVPSSFKFSTKSIQQK